MVRSELKDTIAKRHLCFFAFTILKITIFRTLQKNWKSSSSTNYLGFIARGVVSLLLLNLIVVLTPVSARCATFSARISQHQISINNSVTLTLTLNGSYNNEPELSILDKDFEIGARSHSSQMNIINGHINHSTIWRIGLFPKREGTLTIPSLCCDNVCSMPLTVVVKGQSNKTNDAPVLLETAVSSTKVIAQSQLIYTIRLLMQQPLSEAALSQLQPQGGETDVKIVPDDLSYNITREGQTYQVIERNYILFPQQAGELQLPPIQLDGILPSNGTTGRSAFAPGTAPFDLIGQRGQRIRLHSKAMSVTVTDPEAHNPQEPWLPAQKLSINDDWQQHPPTLTVGEAATRTITTSVSALSSKILPELKIEAPQGFKTYPDKTVRNDHISRDGIRGEMVQKIAMVPTQAGTFTLPETSMRWWDRTDQNWKTATLKAVTIQVMPSEHSGTATRQVSEILPTATLKTTPPAPTVAPLSPQTSATAQASAAEVKKFPIAVKPQNKGGSTPLQNNPWMWIALACVVGWIITIIFYRRHQHPSTPEPSPSTAPAARKMITAEQHQKVTRRHVIQLAQTHQAAETRKALVAWIEIMRDGETGGSQSQTGYSNKPDIDSFLQLVDEPLRREIHYLERYLFAQNSPGKTNTMQQGMPPGAEKETAWDGTVLAQQLQQLDMIQLMKKKRPDNKGMNGADEVKTKKGDDLPSFYP